MITSLKWPLLKPADIVEVIAPASAPISAYDVQEVKDFITALGLTPRIPTDLLSNDLPYCANSDAYRLEHLATALAAPDSSAIWCMRGGYGSSIIIPELAKLAPINTAKAFIGFSDITALHLFLNNHWHWSTIHANCLVSAMKKSTAKIKDVLFNSKALIYEMTALNELAKTCAQIQGVITGGNLSLVEHSLATSWQIEAKDKIIFLEEVAERGYRIERSLEHLLQAGVFKHAKALLLGAFNQALEKDGNDYSNIAIARIVAKLDIPVFSIPYMGHNVENPPLPFYTNCHIRADEEIILTCELGNF
jgi:muramoyltetrapeptide carboxypeptidase